jgi:hypothetical protein
MRDEHGSGVQNWSAPNCRLRRPRTASARGTVLAFGVNAGVYTANNDFSQTPFYLSGLAFGAGTVTLTGNALAFVADGDTPPAVTNVSGHTAVVNNDIGLGTDTVFCAVNNLTLAGVVSGQGRGQEGVSALS